MIILSKKDVLDLIKLNKKLNKIDLSQINDLSEVFKNSQKGLKDIVTWNTSSITNIRAIFMDAKRFNQPLSNWDVANITDMSSVGRAKHLNKI